MSRLVRALLVKYLYYWSLPDLEWQVRFNLIAKWFVGYPIADPGPDHSSLERIVLWVCCKQHRTVKRNPRRSTTSAPNSATLYIRIFHPG